MTTTLRGIPWARLAIELLVIVAGILIALAAESWWQGRSDQLKVQHYLASLEEDLLSDSVFHVVTAIPRLERKREALDAIAPVIRGQVPVPADTIAFLTEVGLGGLFGIPGGLTFSESTTMDELVATGGLGLFESAELRAALTAYYTERENAAERGQALMPNYPLWVHGVSPAELREERTDADSRAWGIERSVQQVVSPEFETIMNREYNYMLYMSRVITILVGGTEEMLLRVRCERGRPEACRVLEDVTP